jgi:hypothetical protein
VTNSGVPDAGDNPDGGDITPDQCPQACSEHQQCSGTTCHNRYSALNFTAPLNGEVLNNEPLQVTVTLEVAVGRARQDPATISFAATKAGAAAGTATLTLSSPGVYTGTWTPPSVGGEFVLTASWSAAGLQAAVTVTIGHAPCARQCVQGWSLDAQTCRLSAITSLGEVRIEGKNSPNRLEATQPQMFGVPSTSPYDAAERARVCGKVEYVDGGIWNNYNEYAYTITCNGSNVDISRGHAWNCKPCFFCWDDVPVNTQCGVSNLGPLWTPFGQGNGINLVSFATESYARPTLQPGDPACY